MTEHADVVVIGMGPGGEEAATRLARAGLAVVGVEKELLGGECPYWACVPTKMMVRATDLLAPPGHRVGIQPRRPTTSKASGSKSGLSESG